MAKRGQCSHKAIVDYWINWEITNKEVAPFGDWDWEEAACMACGFTNNFNDSWKWLQRCHIVPVRLGGSSEPSNFVLMCDNCHGMHRDSTDPEETFKWMRAREGAWFTETAAYLGVKL